jgi:hypothetical protein
MTPEAAVFRTCHTLARMQELYGRPVFDEWALVAVAGRRGRLLGYDGPRRDGFARRLAADLSPLRAELEGRPRDPGAFEFAREARGGSIDACIVAGPSVYLLFNHTEASVRDIAADVRWRKAQAPFAELAEAFRLDPVASGPAAGAAEAAR